MMTLLQWLAMQEILRVKNPQNFFEKNLKKCLTNSPVCGIIISERGNKKKEKKEIKKMVTVKVFSKIGITYFVEKNNIISAQLFRLGHLLRGSGYQTEIVQM